jgi:ribose/xylose/arabinose/galactoside ABC-type transport system permease subunit
VTDIRKILIVIGLSIAVLGLLLWLAGRSGVPLGQLPGDIHVNRPGFKFYFPLTTCLILSAVLTLILWLLRKR